MIRRTIILLFFALAFIAGIKVERSMQLSRCTEAGGIIQDRALCMEIKK